MTKLQLLDLVGTLRAEVSLLTTQLAASRTASIVLACSSQNSRAITVDAVRRLAVRFPTRASFTADEVREEASCSA